MRVRPADLILIRPHSSLCSNLHSMSVRVIILKHTRGIPPARTEQTKQGSAMLVNGHLVKTHVAFIESLSHSQIQQLRLQDNVVVVVCACTGNKFISHRADWNDNMASVGRYTIYILFGIMTLFVLVLLSLSPAGLFFTLKFLNANKTHKYFLPSSCPNPIVSRISPAHFICWAVNELDRLLSAT